MPLYPPDLPQLCHPALLLPALIPFNSCTVSLVTCNLVPLHPPVVLPLHLTVLVPMYPCTLVSSHPCALLLSCPLRLPLLCHHAWHPPALSLLLLHPSMALDCGICGLRLRTATQGHGPIMPNKPCFIPWVLGDCPHTLVPLHPSACALLCPSTWVSGLVSRHDTLHPHA